MPDQFTIRLATVDDVDTIADHRARMFDEMGDVRPGAFETLRTKSGNRLREFLDRGEYIGWLATPAEQPDLIVGGAGVQLRQTLPHPQYLAGNQGVVAEGRHAIIINVFTEPEWRRRGIAQILMRRIIEWARAEELDSLVLHASDAGRSLYEHLGFVRTNEMRLGKK